MSFILESIKQAERDRKLGQQQAPSISIEYTGSHVDDIEDKKLQWLLYFLGIITVSLIAWGVTNYYAKKDRQYIEDLSFEDTSSANIIESDAAINTITMEPVKNLHTSKLKSVKHIAGEDNFPIIQESKKANKETENNINDQPIKNTAESIRSQANSAQSKEFKVDTNKLKDNSQEHELAAIYSDLAELAKQEKMVRAANVPKHKSNEEIVQIETASYAAPEIEVSDTNVSVINEPEAHIYKRQHQKAVSSGVPGFGELPYDIQEKIPEFNVSVHMFHADPVQRRIRINGHMYTEGKSLQKDLVLVEITRYGAVFDYQGHLFRLNVR